MLSKQELAKSADVFIENALADLRGERTQKGEAAMTEQAFIVGLSTVQALHSIADSLEKLVEMKRRELGYAIEKT